MIEFSHVMAPLVDEVFRCDEASPCSIHAYLDASGIKFTVPVVAIRIFEDVEPIPIPVMNWDDPIAKGECVRFVYIPQGGGGGSNPAQLIMTIGMVAAAMYFPPALGMTTVTASGATVLSGSGIALSAGIMVGGAALMNTMFGVKVSDQNQSSGSSLQAQSIATGGQIPAIDSVIPVAFGKNTWAPPRASHDWVEYIAVAEDLNRTWDQFANVLLCLGPGEHEIHKIEIGGSDINSLEGISWQYIPPGGTITLPGYHDNMYTSPHVGGAELSKYGRKFYQGMQYLESSHPPDFGAGWPSDPTIDGHCILYVYHPSPNDYPYADFVAGEKVIVAWAGGSIELTFQESRTFTEGGMLYEIAVFQETSLPAGAPDVAEREYTITEKTDDSRIYVGPYPVCKTTQQVDQICIDLCHPSGLYRMRDDGQYGYLAADYRVDCRALSLDGTPIGDFGTLGAISFNRRTISTFRTTHKFTVSPGCYEVRVSRPIENANIKDVDQCQWVGLRGRLPAKMTYSDVAVIPMRIKAGTYLNNAVLNDIKVQSTRKLPTHNGTAYTSPVATRSIAWAIADVSRNSDYSIGLSDDRIDIGTLRALDATWAARGDYCDGILTGEKTFWKVLSMMARCGRAIPQVPGGIVTLKRDEPQTIKKASFHVRNIVRGSFSIEYILYEEDSPDDVNVKYTDSETGESKSTLCSLPTADGVAPAEFPLWGVGNLPQARREGLHEAACNMYRRALASFTAANYAGRPLRRGDLISVSHPLPNWGVSGEVLAVDKTTRTLTLSEPPVWTEGEDHYIQLSQKNGVPDGPWLVTPGATDVEVIMAEDPPAWIYTGGQRLRTPFQFGAGDNYEALCLVVSATPKGTKGNVDFVVSLDDPRVHPAEETA